MEIKAKYEINGEKLYTLSQLKQILDSSAYSWVELASSYLHDGNPACLRLAQDCLIRGNALISFSSSLEDYLKHE